MIEFAKLSTIGLITGILNGLFGSGGGTIVVPALNLIMKTEVHKCHATAIAVILPLTIASSLVYAFHGITDWPLTIKVGMGSVVGGYIGASLLNRINSSMLKKIFGIFMIAAAIRMWFN
ncbi:MAG: sulfite exporter TauE/SafE family protein [Thermoanaerobacteraceae bacterium]|nr:sulfite exporter TauE/SafE family protein [Thermoanaerobacteraceae bacterium]